MRRTSSSSTTSRRHQTALPCCIPQFMTGRSSRIFLPSRISRLVHWPMCGICLGDTGRSMTPLAIRYGAARASLNCASAPAGSGRAPVFPALVHAHGEVSHGRVRHATPCPLDTDIGSDVDDLLALALLVGAQEVQLIGVTTVYGDTVLRAR